ncbi:hypothetical protein FF38_09072 [Lucilia cuprina]|uniref:Uncharacterized protein n=1 Tax=Lucilia cuprina TaxID=7375 RepID=A0A0L0BVB1_LUCCU|nr:hypothetical protein FF38_09072 [Lucilia cuprina]
MEKEIIKEFGNFLKIFEEATQYLQGQQYPTISCCIFFNETILNLLENTEIESCFQLTIDLCNFAKTNFEEVKKLLNEEDQQISDCPSTSKFVEPKNKKQKLSSGRQSNSLEDEVKKYLEKMPPRLVAPAQIDISQRCKISNYCFGIPHLLNNHFL